MIDSVSGNFDGKVKFEYLENDIFGDEDNFTTLARWRPAGEIYPGSWSLSAIPFIDRINNYFTTLDNYSSANLSGDWTIGSEISFRRIFYSRQNGNWNDPNSWTYSPTHSGPIFGPADWPDNSLDSAVIGGGDVFYLLTKLF